MEELLEKIAIEFAKLDGLSIDDNNLKKRIKILEKLVRDMKQVQTVYTKRQAEYAHVMLDLVKRRTINVPYTKRKIRTTRWLTGYERTKEAQKIEQSKKNKKAKTRN